MRAKYLYEQYFKPLKNELPNVKVNNHIEITLCVKFYTEVEPELGKLNLL